MYKTLVDTDVNKNEYRNFKVLFKVKITVI